MYHLIVRQFVRCLKNLDAIMEQAREVRRRPQVRREQLPAQRLYPDMLPFLAQIRIACDTAKAPAADLSGKEAPKYEDNEKTFERAARPHRQVSRLPGDASGQGLREDQGPDLSSSPNRPGKTLRAEEYLVGRQLPNFYFHVATAYDFLRGAAWRSARATIWAPWKSSKADRARGHNRDR